MRTATTSARKLGMWLFLVTEMVLFGGLFIAYSLHAARATPRSSTTAGRS